MDNFGAVTTAMQAVEKAGRGTMGITLTVETGNVTSPAKERRSFRIEVPRPPTGATLSFVSGPSGAVLFDDWLPLVQQVKEKELVKRHAPDLLLPPLGQPSILSVVQQISSTPTYQLFLAAIDIAEHINLVSESTTETVARRFRSLDKWTPSAVGKGGLFFVPADIPAPSQAVNELIDNNKLGSAQLGFDGAQILRLYVPYATPIDFIIPVSKDAKNLWETISNLYYAFRYPA